MKKHSEYYKEPVSLADTFCSMTLKHISNIPVASKTPAFSYHWIIYAHSIQTNANLSIIYGVKLLPSLHNRYNCN